MLAPGGRGGEDLEIWTSDGLVQESAVEFIDQLINFIFVFITRMLVHEQRGCVMFRGRSERSLELRGVLTSVKYWPWDLALQDLQAQHICQTKVSFELVHPLGVTTFSVGRASRPRPPPSVTRHGRHCVVAWRLESFGSFRSTSL